MTFPLMPQPRPPQFKKGSFILRSTAYGTFDVGDPSEDRWLVVSGARFSSNSISAWAAPTVNGVAMTQLYQDNSNAGDDGHRGAVWIAPIRQGSSVTLAGSGPAVLNAFTLTGVRNPVTNHVTVGLTGSITSRAGSPAIGYWVINFNAISSVTGMSLTGVGSAAAVGVDASMDTDTVTYTLSATGALNVRRLVSWIYDY